MAGDFDCILRDDFTSHLVLDTFEIPALRTPRRACPELAAALSAVEGEVEGKGQPHFSVLHAEKRQGPAP
jgi:hypothetical protein